jgi:hypothetical protein
MKIRTIEAAQKLAIHPANLLLHVAELDSSLQFGDVWPEIDEDWLETISELHGYRSVPERPAPTTKGTSTSLTLSFSAVAKRVLDKLHRQGKWGSVSVAFDSLMNLARASKRDLEGALDELRTNGVLDRDHDGTGVGKISLSPGMRKQIEKVLARGRES